MGTSGLRVKPSLVRPFDSVRNDRCTIHLLAVLGVFCSIFFPLNKVLNFVLLFRLHISHPFGSYAALGLFYSPPPFPGLMMYYVRGLSWRSQFLPFPLPPSAHPHPLAKSVLRPSSFSSLSVLSAIFFPSIHRTSSITSVPTYISMHLCLISPRLLSRKNEPPRTGLRQFVKNERTKFVSWFETDFLIV